MAHTNKIALAIHGGAGTILKSEMTVELERDYRQALENALLAGWEVLRSNGKALDAAEAATVVLEDFPLFNAGKGAVFTHDGKNEMDACLMDGSTMRAGAVAFVRNVKNPIKLARLVMERTPHVLLAGKGADEFAREMNVELEPDEYFFTDFRYRQLLKARAAHRIQLDHTAEEPVLIEEVLSSETQALSHGLANESPETDIQKEDSNPMIEDPKPIGTVGAVACDFEGNVAAATSTGGMTNKKYGRIGDTPLVGAGTFADNRTCAVSCTGHGEFFMLTLAAYDVAALMKYKNLNLDEAARAVVENLRSIGGEGGLIAVDALGNVSLPFNSEGMYRGWMTSADSGGGGGEPTVEIYKQSETL